MKIGIAQISSRPGDLDILSERMFDQAQLAMQQGVSLLCFPAPLIAGANVGDLLLSTTFEHAMLMHLQELAARLVDPGIALLVPAPVAFSDDDLFELFLLHKGRVTPLRLCHLFESLRNPARGWSAPVFDFEGLRFAVSCNAERDAAQLPAGVDCFVYFPLESFSADDILTTGFPAARDGAYEEVSREVGSYVAVVQPLGAYDDAVYTGGSFVMDASGSIAAQGHAFSEDLVVCELQRGEASPAPVSLDSIDASYSRVEWVWGALTLYIRDALAWRSTSRALVVLDGDLRSSLLAALAVDALGVRNVVGLVLSHDTASTPAMQHDEEARLDVARKQACRLGLDYVERSCSDISYDADDAPSIDRFGNAEQDRDLRALCVRLTGQELDAVILSPLTKTDAALNADDWILDPGIIAPLGDIYLTSLEFLARYRNRISATIPSQLVSLDEIRRDYSQVLTRAVSHAIPFHERDDFKRASIDQLLGHEPGELDGALGALIDQDIAFDDMPLAAHDQKAARLISLLLQRGESSRSRLPEYPILSRRSLRERTLPASFGWFDQGRDGNERLSAQQLAREELTRAREEDGDRSELARDEVLSFLGDVLGVDAEQLGKLRLSEGPADDGDGARDVGQQLREAMGRLLGRSAESDSAGQGGGSTRGGFMGSPYFSKN